MNRMQVNIENLREDSKNMKFSLFIARDDFEYDEYDETYTAPGKLHIFYDKPELLHKSFPDTCYWGHARVIAEIPTYMFPNIRENQCVEFNQEKNEKSNI